jgi:hypothetical protein
VKRVIFSLRIARKLHEFGNKGLRKVSERKKGKVSILHNEDMVTYYFWGNKI